MKAKSGRSPGCSTWTGLDQLRPPLEDSWTRACSWLSPAEPSDQPSAILSVAPAPVGSPFAISRLGKELVRAPAIPSNEIDRTPSKAPTSVTFATTCGLSHLFPPSVERDIRKTEPLLTSSQRAETLPLRSVRTEQPCLPAFFPFANAALSVVGRDQVSPPSVEWLTPIFSGP